MPKPIRTGKRNNKLNTSQRRRTKEEMFPMVELWQHSGLSKKRFCEEKGIVKSVFHYWYKKYREEEGQGGFIPLIPDTPHSGIQGPSIEVQYPNGVVLKLPASTPASLVRQYVGQ
jgi:hypothetical protein